jgi:hypothetical protein
MWEIGAPLVDHVLALKWEGKLQTNEIAHKEPAHCSEIRELMLQDVSHGCFQMKRIEFSDMMISWDIGYRLIDVHLHDTQRETEREREREWDRD